MQTGTLNKLSLSISVLALLLLLTACPPHKNISDIQRDTMRYANKEVAVHGTVVQSMGALGTGMYEIDDGTGRIWVYSDKYGVPSRGVRVGVAGRIIPTITFGGRSFATVMRETQRRKFD